MQSRRPRRFQECRPAQHSCTLGLDSLGRPDRSFTRQPGIRRLRVDVPDEYQAEVEDEKVELSALIEIINERFGTTFTEADELFFSQIREEAVADEALQQAATANPLDAFKLVFDKALEGLFIGRMDQNESITARFLDDEDFRGAVSRHLMKQVYEQIRGESLAV